MPSKVCRGPCKLEKSFDHFTKCSKEKDGRNRICRACMQAAQKIARAKRGKPVRDDWREFVINV